MSTKRGHSLVEKMSASSARYITNNGGDPAITYHSLYFTLQIWISVLLIFALSLAIASFVGAVYQTIIVLIVIGVLRYFSGGWHLQNLDHCVVLTTIVAVTIPELTMVDKVWMVVLNLISLILIVIFAPTGHGQQFKSLHQRKWFKLISVFIVIISLILLEQVITLSVFLQSITLIHYSKRR